MSKIDNTKKVDESVVPTEGPKTHPIDLDKDAIDIASVPTTMAGLVASFKDMKDVDDEDIKEFSNLTYEKASKAFKEMKSGGKCVKDIMSSYREEDQPPVEPAFNPKKAKLPVGEHVARLFDGQELSEDFKNEAKVIFETVIADRVAEEVAIIEEQAQAEIANRVEAIKVQLEEKVDQYLSHVAGEWMVENKLAVDMGIKTSIAEDFIVGLKALFEEHNINIPAEQETALEEAMKEKAELEEAHSKTLASNVELKEALLVFQKKEALAAVSEGLAESQKEKLVKLAETVEFKSLEQYSEQLSIIKEHYFPATPAAKENTVVAEEVRVEKVIPAHIAAAAKHISNSNR